MLRLVLLLLLCLFVARTFWRVVDGFIEGVTGQPRHPQVPQQGVQMARDPVCGTFVMPDRALSIVDGRTRHFFCSERCRDTFRSRRGRTA